MKVGVPITDLGAGLFAVFGILCALRARHVTGRGQLVDTSLFEAGLALSAWEATEYWFTGQIPRGLGHGAPPERAVPGLSRPRRPLHRRRGQQQSVPALLRAARPRPPGEGPALRHGRAPSAEPRGARAADRGRHRDRAARALAGPVRGGRRAGRPDLQRAGGARRRPRAGAPHGPGAAAPQGRTRAGPRQSGEDVESRRRGWTTSRPRWVKTPMRSCASWGWPSTEIAALRAAKVVA